MKWSGSKYGFLPEEDRDGEEEIQGGRDRLEATSGGRFGVARHQGSGCGSVDRVTDVTYYRWRREYGGLQMDQVKRMKDLELENQRLRKAVSDLTLDKLILAEAAKGNF